MHYETEAGLFLQLAHDKPGIGKVFFQSDQVQVRIKLRSESQGQLQLRCQFLSLLIDAFHGLQSVLYALSSSDEPV